MSIGVAVLLYAATVLALYSTVLKLFATITRMQFHAIDRRSGSQCWLSLSLVSRCVCVYVCMYGGR
jgi:hypothetical protein